MNNFLARTICNLADKFGIATKSFITSVWTSYDTTIGKQKEYNQTECMDVFATELWVYACVDLIASTIAGLPIRIYREKKKDGKISYDYIDNHPLLDLLNKPNDRYKKGELIYRTQANLDLTGNSYLFKDEIVGGKPTSIYSLISDKVEINVNDNNEIIGYTYKIKPTKPLTYEINEIIHLLRPDPRNNLYGLSPLSSARLTVNTLNEARETNHSIFKNSGGVDGFYSTDQSLNDIAFQRLQEQLKQKYRGSKKAHNTPILEKGLKFTASALPLRDLEFIAGMKMGKEEICSIYKIPIILVNSMESATYNNIKEAMRIFYMLCIIPRLPNITEALQELLSLWGDKTLFIEFDLTNVKALQDDLSEKAKTYQTFVGYGIPINQCIKYLDLPFDEVPNGDISWMPLGLIQSGSPGNQSEPEPSEEPGPETGKTVRLKSVDWTPERKEAKWNKFVTIIAGLETKYKQQLREYFAGQRRIVIDNLNQYKSIAAEKVNGNSFVLTAVKTDIKQAIDIETILFDNKNEIKRLIKTSLPLHLEAFKKSGQSELDLLGLDIAFDIDNPRIHTWITKFGLDKAKSIIDTIKDGLKQELIDGINEGESIDNLAKRISEFYSKYEKLEEYQLERIARTEIVGASNQGALESYNQAGVEKKGWLAAIDERTRETHIEADRRYGEGIPIDDNFEVGGDTMLAPGQGTEPAENINCRCCLIGIIK